MRTWPVAPKFFRVTLGCAIPRLYLRDLGTAQRRTCGSISFHHSVRSGRRILTFGEWKENFMLTWDHWPIYIGENRRTSQQHNTYIWYLYIPVLHKLAPWNSQRCISLENICIGAIECPFYTQMPIVVLFFNTKIWSGTIKEAILDTFSHHIHTFTKRDDVTTRSTLVPRYHW